MITKEEQREAREYAIAELAAVGVELTEPERAAVEVADFGLSRLSETGLQLVVYVNTDRHCAKELVLPVLTASRDELDVFSDPDVRRATVVGG